MNDSRNSTPAPSDWDRDRLSLFISSAQANEQLICRELYQRHPRLSQIHDLFEHCAEMLANNAEPRIPAFMFLRALGAFLGGTRLAMSGQLVEAYPVLRLSLEAALYSLHIQRDPSMELIWSERSKSDIASEKCRIRFSHGKVQQTLESVDLKLAEEVERLYKELIDFGAHPNVDSIFPSVSLETDGMTETFKTHILVPPDNVLMLFTLDQCAWVGTRVLLVYCHVFESRFEALGVRRRVEILAAGLSKL
jgi:hypothetical protein